MHRKGRGDTNAGVCNINKKGERCMLVLDNGKVITRDKACPFIEDGAVAIDGRTIVRVGTSQEIREAYPDAEHIDAGGGLIMPTFDLAASNKPDEVGYHIHVAEGIEDLHHCLKHYGKRIVDRLMDHGVLGEKTLLGHCIYINPHEMDLIRETDTMVVHNPESNMGNACGCPPTMELVHRGILTGLGTDGYTHDMMESYKVANVLHKHHLCDPNAAWAEVPQMLFENNAKIAARYFKPELGVLKEGAAGDVIVVDYNPLTPMNAGNINSHLVFGVTGHDVVTTVADGKVLMKDRELADLDAEKIMADCRQAAAELAGRINSK